MKKNQTLSGYVSFIYSMKSLEMNELSSENVFKDIKQN